MLNFRKKKEKKNWDKNLKTKGFGLNRHSNKLWENLCVIVTLLFTLSNSTVNFWVKVATSCLGHLISLSLRLDVAESSIQLSLRLNEWSHVLFMKLINAFFNKFFIKIESNGTIHIFKNYFVTIFSVFNNKGVSKQTLRVRLINWM